MKKLLFISILLIVGCEEPAIEGCIDTSACNYNADATKDDNSCIYAEENYDCNGNCLGNLDCAGECSGNNVLDNCDVCDADTTNDCVQDCADTWGGDAVEDNCGTCDADSSNDCITDCNGDYGGAAVEDECGVCDSDSTNDGTTDNCGTCDNDATNDCVQDCADVYGGTSWVSDCGCVSATNSGDDCDDCAGTPNGDKVADNCGTCDNDSSNDCVQDCAGEWGGTSWESDCGCVAGDNDGNDCDDCAGTPNGTAVLSGCDNLCNSTAVLDECGVCGGDNSSCTFGTDLTLDIVTWNIEQFPKLGEATIEYLVEIIQSSKIDIIALQEIGSETDFNNLVNELDGWVGYRANSASYNIDLAYLYKTELTIISIEEIELLDNYNFSRTPLQMKIEWNGDNIYIINNHFKCCGNGTIENVYNDEEYRRKMASQGLQDYVELYHPYDKVIILGDLNDEITDPEAQNVFWNFISNATEYQFVDMSVAEGSSDDWSYPTWPSHLDHILISSELFASVHDVACIKYEMHFEEGWSQYESYISDHRPVGIQLY